MIVAKLFIGSRLVEKRRKHQFLRSHKTLFALDNRPIWTVTMPQGGKTISERKFEPMTKAEVVAAQRAWAKHVTEQDLNRLLDLYDFGDADEPLLFKPTLADVIRLDRKGARAYFVGGDPDYPQDTGFLKRGWKKVEFQSAVGPILKAGGLGYKDMGHYTFVDGDGNATRADYTFAYHKLDGRVLISLHHSSLTWLPPVGD